ncbi:MAG: exodeoxyribonuclease VII large subunit [Myxococcales bacterium]|nr:exodeoxyribonuclease VII large subunit [Myxococcales bacterium]
MVMRSLFDGLDEGGGSGGKSGGSERQVFRVSQLNRMVRQQLEGRFGQVRVEGEVSDLTRAASGHVYFTLNDELDPAQLRVVMFRSDARRSKARLQNGARVELRGTLSLFEPRGSYQMIARTALPAGLGELHAQFEAVRKKLETEGLLDPARKRALPLLPRVLGVVTSEKGAALHDIVRVAHDRCPLPIVVAPTLVQGAEAPVAIVRALSAIAHVPELDVVIVGRGGGAAEDLVAFNDERVARAIAACPVPVVSAVGHEVDVTIADLVADVRAATPSNAAELCVPDRQALQEQLDGHLRRLQRALEMKVARARLRLDRAARRVADPRTALGRVRVRLSVLERRNAEALGRRLRAARRQQQSLAERLRRRDPRLLLSVRRQRLVALRTRLGSSIGPLLSARRARLSELSARLSALSPLNVLGRGYAIAIREADGRALLRASDAEPGERLRLRLHEGQLPVRVERS